jgi:hypothetical protein
MLSNQISMTIEHLGTEQDTQAKARKNAGLLFEHVHGQARLAQWWGKLTGRAQGLRTLARQPEAGGRGARIVTVPLAQIVGTEDRGDDFDAAFRPLRKHNRDRWIGVAAARRTGSVLPPVDLVQDRDGYYVRDGHHRISVAKAVGQLEIEARVVNG